MSEPLWIRAYRRGIRLWLAQMKPLASRVVNIPKKKRPFREVSVVSLQEYGEWLEDHAKYRPDLLGEGFDSFPALGHLQWQLETRGYIEDDCDGLAYFSARQVLRFCDSPLDCYVVSIVLEPRETEKKFEETLHALCIFKSGGRWRVIECQYLHRDEYAAFDEALRENPYTRGEQLLYWEKRNAWLELVDSGVS